MEKSRQVTVFEDSGDKMLVLLTPHLGKAEALGVDGGAVEQANMPGSSDPKNGG